MTVKEQTASYSSKPNAIKDPFWERFEIGGRISMHAVTVTDFGTIQTLAKRYAANLIHVFFSISINCVRQTVNANNIFIQTM